jgi:hypothetical protein
VARVAKHGKRITLLLIYTGKKKRVKISLLQAVEALRVARGRGSHIT